MSVLGVLGVGSDDNLRKLSGKTHEPRMRGRMRECGGGWVGFIFKSIQNGEKQ